MFKIEGLAKELFQISRKVLFKFEKMDSYVTNKTFC